MKILIAIAIIIAIGATFWFTSQNQEETLNEPVAMLPVITREQIITASDLVEGVKQALKQDDEKAIEQWLDRALALAKEAGIAQEDINFIQSDSARDYVIFQAKRSQFNDAVEQAYYELQGIDAIKAAYPQAEDLFASADKLIIERDKIIEEIATELANGNTPTNAERQAARQQWLKRYNEKQSQ